MVGRHFFTQHRLNKFENYLHTVERKKNGIQLIFKFGRRTGVPEIQRLEGEEDYLKHCERVESSLWQE